MKLNLKKAQIETLLGAMVVIADTEKLYFLAFHDQKNIEKKVALLEKEYDCIITTGATLITKNIAAEIKQYFSGKNIVFKTPLHFVGSVFQKKVWEALQKIPEGKTQSYLEVAAAIKKPTAFRAVANANGSNPLSIVVPCHRVIHANGALGGYAGGIERKKWLLAHEKNRKV
ncbi:MAG: hypothetical protein COY58_02350 [Gammaproteobacteria bacterium CG_4_10_14_0_8_um_filter_38_16]|nr:MAG: hypothetical protein COY58_02350 [Gammaproteobacteria bacterium CG_4_10_14_0_8_um_filter_38_16]PJA03776.1 MAG: hypothetical protein COX72_02510 [Gammaproteobacteria bacterium CG_4_10_14_0_2_um_filter_38_22]PJB10387.1 MAG: hypothetical protein CO120_05055 [Gammaproteobacteria bacterium CG_4_9_14_3_um_filter_38_9]